MADATVVDLPTLKKATCPAGPCDREVIFYEDGGGDVVLLQDGSNGSKKSGVTRTVVCACGTEYTIPTP